MEITLRKASALQNSIQETLHSITVESTIQVNEYVNSETAILNANRALLEADARRVALYIAYYNIRSLVGVANISSGINMKLATAAFIDKRVGQLTEMIQSGVRDMEVVERKIAKIRESDTTHQLYGRQSEVSTSVLTQEQLDAFRQELSSLKKQKQSLNDEILELNIQSKIPLAQTTIDVLTAEGLL